MLSAMQLSSGALLARQQQGGMRCRAGRHKDYMATAQDPYKPVEVRDRPNVEADVRYRRVDNSAELAAEARYAFAAGLQAGEARLQLARLALLIAAEDDAIASSSVVRFPVEAYMSRMQRLAADTAAAVAAAAAARVGNAPSSSSSEQCGPWSAMRSLPPSEVVAAVQHALFQQQQPQQPQQQQQLRHQQQQQQHQPTPQAGWYSSIRCAGFKAPPYGRSNLPPHSMLDHPGVWEDARMAYLNEVLVRKTGSPAALVILLCEVYQQLLLMGAIDFAVTFEYGDFSTLPVARPLPNLTLQQLVLQPAAATSSIDAHASLRSSSSSSSLQDTTSSSHKNSDSSSSTRSLEGVQLLNTCSSEALCELLRHLKRAYWPFAWDTNIDSLESGGRGSCGGFRAAAKAALGSDEMSAALRAVSATAAHRLQRGIWTSPGAGDLSRCVAACERLVMLTGDVQPQERRDLAVLLLHAGQPAAAAAELSAYLDSIRRQPFGAQAAAAGQDPFDVRLAQDVWKLLKQSGVKPARDVMSVEAVIARGGRGSVAGVEQGGGSSDGQASYKPLTW